MDALAFLETVELHVRSVAEIPIELAVAIGDAVEGLGMRDMVGSAQVAGDPLVTLESVGDGVLLASRAVDSPYFNRAFGFGMSAPTDDTDLDLIAARFATAPCVSLVGVNAPGIRDTLTERYGARGWVLGDEWVKMFRLAEPVTAIPTSLQVRRLGTDDASGAAEVLAEAFHLPPAAEAMLPGMLANPHWHVYGACDGHHIVATGALAVYGKVGYLSIGATRASYRNRGAQGAIMSQRLRDGRELGCELFVTETGADTEEQPNPSFHNMARLGFEIRYSRTNYLIMPAQG